MTNIITKLTQILGQSYLITDPQILVSYTTDWRHRYVGQAFAVALPQTVLQIQQIVELCKEYQIAIVPQGGNTSTCAAATPLTNYFQPQLIINLKPMNKIISIDAANSNLIVEAGCILTKVQEYADRQNLYFPLSMGSEKSAQIGGTIATNAGGMHVLKYGMMRNLVLGLEWVTPQGEIISQLNSVYKNNTYVDLKQLLIGSEGTLGIITKASLKLYPKPSSYTTFLIGLEDLAQGINLFRSLNQKYPINACEIIHNSCWKIYQQIFPQNSFKNFNTLWLMILEIEMEIDLDPLVNHLTSLNLDLEQVFIATNQEERHLIWAMREELPLAEKAYGYAAKHDISIPISQIENFINYNQARIHAMYPQGYFSVFGHLGDGNLHYNFGLPNLKPEELLALEAKVSPIVYQDVIKFNGSISAEHGIGFSKKQYFKEFTKPNNYAMALELKQSLDPNNLFNPGKIFV